MSCKLISESMNLIIVNEETMLDTQEFISKRLSAVKSQRSTGELSELEDLALIIGKPIVSAILCLLAHVNLYNRRQESWVCA